MTCRSELYRAALELAAAGHPILPLHTPTVAGCSCGQRKCSSCGKHPRSIFGLRQATADLEQVDAWWHGQPEANIGMRCDGLVVIDVDGRQGERSLREPEGELGQLPATREQRSARGRHLLFSVAGISLGNSTRPLGDPPGLDLRAGERGYIVAAPSRHASGKRYRWLDPEAPLAPLPHSWLRCLRRPLRLLPLPPSLEETTGSTAYGRSALEAELDSILCAGDGARNNTLNRSVFKLAQLVAEHRLARKELEEGALEAALLIGLTPLETQRTIRSALEAGLRSPRRR
jgi:Bifunctional DNA primase/polymerase, N-terminal